MRHFAVYAYFNKFFTKPICFRTINQYVFSFSHLLTRYASWNPGWKPGTLREGTCGIIDVLKILSSWCVILSIIYKQNAMRDTGAKHHGTRTIQDRDAWAFVWYVQDFRRAIGLQTFEDILRLLARNPLTAQRRLWYWGWSAWVPQEGPRGKNYMLWSTDVWGKKTWARVIPQLSLHTVSGVQLIWLLLLLPGQSQANITQWKHLSVLQAE